MIIFVLGRHSETAGMITPDRGTSIGAIFLLILFLCVSCSSEGDNPNSTTVSLAGTKWMLTSYGNPESPTPVQGDVSIRLNFSDTSFSGSLGCNTFRGEYELVTTSEISMHYVDITTLYCEGQGEIPSKIMEQEYAVENALGNVTGLFISDKILKLYYNKGTGVLNYSGSSEAADLRASIASAGKSFMGDELRAILQDASGDEQEFDLELEIKDRDRQSSPIVEHSVRVEATSNGQYVYWNESIATEKGMELFNEDMVTVRTRFRESEEKRRNALMQAFLYNARSRELSRYRAGIPRNTWDKVKIHGLGIVGRFRKDQIRAIVKDNSEDIAYIGIKPKEISQLHQAAESVGVRPFAYSNGYTGVGVGIWKTNEYPTITTALSGKVTGLGLPCKNDNPTDQQETVQHETQVSEVLVSQDATLRGIAPDAHLYWGCGEMIGGVSLVPLSSSLNPRVYVVASASVIGYSSGYPYENKAWDDYVYDHRMVAVRSAGNAPTKNSSYPSSAHSVISVGGYDDRFRYQCSSNETLYDSYAACMSECFTGSCLNPIMAWWSTYKNPITTHNDREFPTVVAPGQNISGPSGWTNAGTSLSAPIVAGIAADLISTSGAFKYRPEMVSASIIGGAYDNIEGSSRLSEKDGAGGVDYLFTHHLYRTTYYWEGGNSSFFNSNGEKDVTYTLYAGKRYRAAVVWSSRGDWPYEHNGEPQMDIDLKVYRPDGSFMTSSSSWDNSFEIVDFIAPEAGDYRFVIKRYSNRYSSSIPKSGVKMSLSIGRNE